MFCLTRKFWNDDAGIVISAELVLILTIVVIGVIVGLVQVQHAIVAELNDIAFAFSHLNQSYAFTGFHAWKWMGWPTAWTAGSSFIDLYDGIGLAAVGEIGTGYGYGYAQGGGYAYGSGYSGGYAVEQCSSFCEASYGTIVLTDGTLIVITHVASGTWSLPGGAILAATSANSNQLRLADGTIISFLYGIAGTIELADGTIIGVRPGTVGNWVLADGRTVTLDANEQQAATLSDGTKVKFQLANPARVILPDGSSVEVKAGAPSTLVLPDGRALDLHTAVPQATTTQPTLAPTSEAPPTPGELPHAPVPQPGTGVGVPGRTMPAGPRGVVIIPDGLPGEPQIPTSRFPKPRKRLIEVPQGPAPQNLPQL